MTDQGATVVDRLLASSRLSVAGDLVKTADVAVRCCQGEAGADEGLSGHLQGKVARRAALRAGWGGVPAAVFRAASDAADPLRTVSHRAVPFRTRAALKLADIDQAVDLLDFVKQAVSPTFYFLDICGAPGSWTEYFLWATHTPGFLDESREPRDTVGWGISLATDNETLDWQLDSFHKTARAKCPSSTDFCFWGETGDGDVTDENNLVQLAVMVQEKTGGRGVHLAMGDGGIIEEGAFESAEQQLRRVVLCEALAALLTVARGGNCALKILDVNTSFSACLLFLLYSQFDEVDLVKPTLSRPANSERYFVGKHRRTDPPFISFSIDSPAKTLSLLSSAASLDPSQICQLLFAINALEASPDTRLDCFVPRACLLRDPSFPSWLRSRNERDLDQQIRFCELISAVIAALQNPDDAAKHGYSEQKIAQWQAANAKLWWEHSRLQPFISAAAAKRQKR
ncbi:Cap-specific mRNA (nucleoside-2prime-O-)-methyltransferase 1 [Diplonema papillatum]|nr:Cap-specific mRNA (nucleoside-2prime-O-)-methyltransferase 1 [Diplonema papillatum]|eukprot:gene7615-11663_t